jgi:hypothetical protein
MNTKFQIMAGLVLGSAILVGCEERPEAGPRPDRTVPSTPTPDTTRPSTPSTTDAQSRAQTLILQFHQQIDSGDFKAAEQTLQQLEGMRSSLPQATQDQIDQMRNTLRQRQGGTTPTTTEPATPPGR